MELPTEILITVAGGGASVIVAWGIAQQKISSISAALVDIEKRLRALDNRVDKTEGQNDLLENRVNVIASMNSPDALEKRHREIASVLKDIEFLRKQWDLK